MAARRITKAARAAIIEHRIEYLRRALHNSPLGCERDSFAWQAFLCLTNPTVTPIEGSEPKLKNVAAVPPRADVVVLDPHRRSRRKRTDWPHITIGDG